MLSSIFLERKKTKRESHEHHKHIADASWSTFVNMLEYKGKWYGCDTYKIYRYYPSTKTCSNCNFTLNSIGLDVEEWNCPICGTHHDRDINAAINILREGLREKSAGTVDYTDGECTYVK